MANVIGKRIAGNLVYVDRGAHDMRVVDAIGPDVHKFEFNQWTMGLAAERATGTDSDAFTTTVVEAGTGTSEFTGSQTAGTIGKMVAAADENDGIQVQTRSEEFEFTSNQSMVYFGIQLAPNDADQSDWLAGLCITDTTLLGGMTDGVYFESLDGATSYSSVTEKDSSETQTDSLADSADDTFMFLEFYFDGSSVYFYTDGTLSSTIHTTNIPDDEALAVSLAFLTGEAVANTLSIRRWNVFAIGRT